MHIIETIGSWGVKTSRAGARLSEPRAGDAVEFEEEQRHYPISHRLCRIASIDRASGMVSIVDGMGSAFLNDASLSIYGVPFFSVPLESLEPTMELETMRFWNWGDNSPGAGQGVEYRIDRPRFRATQHPYDHDLRYGRSEKAARSGGEYSRGPISDGARLVRSWESHDGLTAYLFDVREERSND